MRFSIRSILFTIVIAIGGAVALERSEAGTDDFNKFAANSKEPMFSVEVDTATYLGQKQRRRGSGGRVWGNLYYSATTLEPKNADYKIKPDSYGAQLGFDVVHEHGIYSSFFFNFNEADMKIGSFAKSKNDTFLFGYAKYIYLAGCHFGFQGAVGYDEYKVRDLLAADRKKGNGMQMNLFGEFGVDMVFGQWAIKPFYALQYDFLYHGRIGDKGNVFKSDWNGHGFQQLFGMKINWKPGDVAEFQIRTTWVHEWLNNTPPFYHARFSPIQGIATPSVYFFEGNTGRDWAWLGFGIKLEAVYNILMYLDYDCMINGRQTTHLGNFGLCFGW